MAASRRTKGAGTSCAASSAPPPPRRAVRPAWWLGRREPTLVRVVQAVIDSMGEVYPELRLRAKHLVDTTRAEEERFLETIEGGMSRFDQLAPAGRTTQGSLAMQ